MVRERERAPDPTPTPGPLSSLVATPAVRATEPVAPACNSRRNAKAAFSVKDGGTSEGKKSAIVTVVTRRGLGWDGRHAGARVSKQMNARLEG